MASSLPADPADPYDDTITQRLALPYNFSVNTDDLTKGRGGFFYNDGGRAGYMGGGIADLRQGYFLGKLVKKATRGIKKIFKSPLGKAALIGGLGYLGGGVDANSLNLVYNLADFVNKILFGLIIWNAAVKDSATA